MLAWCLWRQRYVIKVDPRYTLEVWFYGSSDCCVFKSWCHMLVCRLWLCQFLVILTFRWIANMHQWWNSAFYLWNLLYEVKEVAKFRNRYNQVTQLKHTQNFPKLIEESYDHMITLSKTKTDNSKWRTYIETYSSPFKPIFKRFYSIARVIKTITIRTNWPTCCCGLVSWNINMNKYFYFIFCI